MGLVAEKSVTGLRSSTGLLLLPGLSTIVVSRFSSLRRVYDRTSSVNALRAVVVDGCFISKTRFYSQSIEFFGGNVKGKRATEMNYSNSVKLLFVPARVHFVPPHFVASALTTSLRNANGFPNNPYRGVSEKEHAAPSDTKKPLKQCRLATEDSDRQNASQAPGE
jgi:hypothetical protein